MGKQLYETDEDRRRELLFTKKIEAVFNIDTEKLPIHRQLDFLMCRPHYDKGKRNPIWQVVGVGETKIRTCRSDTYPTVILSAHKYEYYLNFYRRYFTRIDGRGNIAFVYFIRYADCDKYARINGVDGYEVERFTARNHADDPTDTERVIHVPTSIFTQF